MIHNIELYPGKGGQLVRSAGVMAQLMAKENGAYALVRLPSGEMRNIPVNCIATIGTVVSNLDHENVPWVRLAASATWASAPASAVPS